MPKLPTDPERNDCPQPEVVAAFVDRRLAAVDEVNVAHHLARCLDCSAVLAETVRIQALHTNHHGGLSFLASKTVLLKLAASIAVVSGLGLTAWSLLAPRVPDSRFERPELADLVAAVGAHRRVEARLTGGFAYGPVVNVDPKRSGDAAGANLPLDLRAAAITLEKHAKDVSDPIAAGAFGIAQLVTGSTEKAVSTFEEALRLAPKDARLLSDASAAYLVRSKGRNQIEDVARAVGLAQQATEADPALPEAQFNLALSLEGLSLRGEATKAWNGYLQIDSTSPWAEEAKQRIERLAESPEARWEKRRQLIIAASDTGRDDAIRAATKQFPDTAYEFVENDLAPQWADAWLASDEPKARGLASRIRLFGQALADGVGDRMALDVAASIERTQGSKPGANALARGHQIFRDARALYEQDRVSDSVESFNKAAPSLEQGQSPLTEWIELHRAIGVYFRGDLLRSVRIVEPLLTAGASRGHLVLAGRALRMRGLLHHLTGHLGDSLDRYNQARVVFEQVGAREDLGAIHAVIAENLEAVGDVRKAWHHHQLALQALAVTPTPRRRHTTLLLLANITRRNTFFDATLRLQNELILDAERSRRAGAVVEGYLGRAEVLGLHGRDRRALADLEEAAQWISRISDEALASRHRAEISLRRGETLARSHPLQAQSAIRESLEFFRTAGLESRMARVHLAAGRISLFAGDLDGAEASFLDGIRTLERQRARLPSGELSWGFLGQPWNLFDEIVELQAQQPGRLHDALRSAERARARDLLKSASSTQLLSSVDPASLSTQVPPDTVVLYFASLETQLLVWIIRSGSVDLVRRPLSSQQLTRLVSFFHASLSAPRKEGAETESEHLFDELIRPLAAFLSTETRLIVVPDGALNALPFAALRNSETKRYLVEDYALVMAPSATMFVRASSRLGQLSEGRAPKVLVVANPLLDMNESGDLPNLSAAEVEGKDIVSLYDDAVLLAGPSATKQAFLQTAGQFGIVHFAGHALSNDLHPLLSRLLLARSSDGRSGSLFAHEILKMRPVHTRLVVLAACRTGMGPISRGEGALSLARPFLAADVPSVIATFWDISDQASQVFFAAFYRSLDTGSEPVAALRAAQLSLIRNSNLTLRGPASWAGFVAWGGVRLSGGV